MGFYQIFRILICFVYLILLHTFIAEAEVWYDGPARVHETHPFTIACNSSLFANIKWRKNEQIYLLEGENFVYVSESRKYSNVTVKYALHFHTGNYKCSYESDDYGHNLTVVPEYKLKVTSDEFDCTKLQKTSQGADTTTLDNNLKCKVAKPYEKFWIQCKPETNLTSNLTVAWFKATENNQDKGTLVRSSDREPNRISITGTYNEKLEFSSVLPEDNGVYHCRVVAKGKESDTFHTAQLIKVQVLPWVNPAHKDVTAIEENYINLTCIVRSNISAIVQWNVSNAEGNNTYTASSGRVTLSNFNGTTNSFFSIRSANLTIDRGLYTCFAKSDAGDSPSNMTFYVRVKSKYAALWPFLGICAEVIILCTIILIYEKKRDKTELEESDTDQGPETKSSPDHGQDSVRYRK